MSSRILPDLAQRAQAEARLQDIEHELHLIQVGAMGAMASTLAHELSQPLTAVANYVQASRSLLDESEASGVAIVREALALAEQEIMRAGQFLHRLREFARAETRKNMEPVAEVIADSCLFGLASAPARGIETRVDLVADLGHALIDHAQIQQVLVTLLRNAVEATVPTGGAVQVASHKDSQYVRVSVADSGPGLPPELCERPFEAFVGATPNEASLALSICRTIVEAHGGKIWYEPAPEGGAAFQFTVPLAQAGEASG